MIAAGFVFVALMAIIERGRTAADGRWVPRSSDYANVIVPETFEMISWPSLIS